MMNVFHVASHLGMMVCDVEDNMPIQELARWIAYLGIEKGKSNGI